MSDPTLTTSVEDIRQRIREARATAEHETLTLATDHYRFIRPLSLAADSLIEVFQNTEGRYLFGLRDIDLMVRGIGKGELCYVTGFAHSGKTQFLLGSYLANRDRPIVMFTLDESAELVLTKLVCMRLGIDADVLESRVKANDPEAIRQVRRVASEDFPKLLVVDEMIGMKGMTSAIHEAEDYFGEAIAATVIDFLELVPTGEDVDKTSKMLKHWTKENEQATVCLHQGSRGNAGKGQRLTMQSMRFGGEAEANFVLGVRRQRDDESLEGWERETHQDTVDISVLKNKRPPSRKGETTFHLDPATGLIRSLEYGDKAYMGMPPTAADIVSQRRQQIAGQTTTDEYEDF